MSIEEKYVIDRILEDNFVDRIIKEIIKDLSDRKGIKGFWCNILYSKNDNDYGVLFDIVSHWRKIIDKEISHEKINN